MFLCRHCIRVYDGVAVSQSEGPCEVCDRLDTCSNVSRYRRKSDREESREIERLRAALGRIADYPSIVPSEEHYRQFPDTERFPDFRVIARDALNS